MIAPHYEIPSDTLDRIRDGTDILALITESVPSLKARGRSFVGRCPFCMSEPEPVGTDGELHGFHVNPKRGFFHCFECNEAGSAFDFVMAHEKVNFREALVRLAVRTGIDLPHWPAFRASRPVGAWRLFGRR